LMSNNPNKLILADPDRSPGDATRCIKEVEKAALSSNVRIFMQAGGTYVWGHEKFRDLNAKIDTAISYVKDKKTDKEFPVTVGMKPSVSVRQWFLSGGGGNTVAKPVPGGNGKLGRYVYDKNHRNWKAREQIRITGNSNTETDMGSKEGLVSFLRAGQKLEQELYPEGNVRRLFIFVDHGGGIDGVCVDEYTKQMLSLKGIKEAFQQVQTGWSNPEEKPFEVVAFDACIMAVYDTALAVEDYANYMVASQESTKGKVMFGYTDLLNDLSKNPSMSAKELGKVICDTTWEDSKVTDKEFGFKSNDVFTESVVDLSKSKMDALKAAYENFETESFNVVQENPDFNTFAKFKNAVNTAEKYPSDEYYALLLDLKNLTNNLNAAFPELQKSGSELVKAIDNAVVYNKRGSILKRGGGLSVSAQFKPYMTLYNQVKRYSINLDRLKEKSVEVDEEKKTAEVELTEEELKVIDSVRYTLLCLLPRNDNPEKIDTVVLGSDSEVEEDLQTGTFKIDLNDKKWFTLNGNPLYVHVVADSTRKGKNGKKIGGNDMCVSPILINGKPYKLFFSRNYPSGKATVIGAIPTGGNSVVTLPSGELESLKKGDVITPLYGYLNEDNISKAESIGYMTPEEFTVSGKPITIGDNPKIEMRSLYNGIFGYVFEFVNPIGGKKTNALTNDGAVCKIKNGKIVKVIRADYFDTPEDLEK